MSECTKKIIELLLDECEFNYDVNEEVDMNSKLDGIGVNSIGFIRFLVNIEMEYNIEFDDEELNLSDYKVVGDLVEFVEGKINGR